VKFLDRFRFAAILLVLVAIVAFCTSQRSFGLLLVSAPLVILCWYVTEGPRGRTLPKWGQNLLLAALLVWTALAWLELPDLAETMGLLGRFVLWLSIIKLYGRKSARDYGQIIALSAVLVMAGTLQSVEFAFAVLVFVYATMLLWAVLLFQLWSARERTRESRAELLESARTALGPAAPSAALVPPVEAVFGRSLVWQFRMLTTVSIILGVLLSIGVFVIFPRELADRLRRDSRIGSRQTGFSEEVRLFSNDRINESRREVFTVEWVEARGESIRFSEPLYLRGAVLDRYEPSEGRWMQGRDGRGRAYRRTVEAERGGPPASLGLVPIDERFQTYLQRVKMRSIASDVVFSAYAPIAIGSDAGGIFEFDTRSLTLRISNAGRVGRAPSYEVKVQPFPNEATMQSLMGEAAPPARSVAFPVPEIVEFSRELLVQLDPADLPEVAEIEADPALRWQRNRRIARALSDWLQSPRFRYTTDLGSFVRLRDEDPILSFLVRYRFGHCEYFASALVAMCQSLGVESRLVTGYLAIEFDETINAYIVRESNAHAWAEVRVGPYQWMRFDPTPQDTLASFGTRNRSWTDRFRWLYDRMEFLWNSQVVGFDSSAQAAIADRVGSGWQRTLFASLAETARRINAYFRFGPAGYIWMGLVGFALVLAVLALVGVRRRRRRLRAATALERRDAAEARRILRQTGFWLDALEALERAGIAKPKTRTPLDHLPEIASSRPAAAHTFAAIVDRYYRIRFAGESLDATGKAETKALVERFRDELSSRPRQPA
jgi:transglutaminase-like putative cysteine protease/heme exporter protein D